MNKFFQTKILVPVLLLTMFVTMLGSSLGDSGIEDERPHIVAGYTYLTTGDFRINPEHPPLIKDLAAAPLLLGGFSFPYEYWGENLNSQWTLGKMFLYDSGNDPDKILLYSRLPIMLLSLLLGYFVFRWARELYGEKAGLFALALYVFDANIIAHSRFVTTDLGIAAAFVIHLYYLWRFLERPTKRNIIITGLTFGIVLITKFSAALLIPIYFLVFVMELIRRRKGKAEDKKFALLYDNSIFKRGLGYILSFSVISLIGVIVLYVFYVPHVWNMSTETAHALVQENLPGHGMTPLIHTLYDVPLMKPIAHYLFGFFIVSGHVTGGHMVFFLGQVANSFPKFYYVAFLIKTALPTLILFATTIYLITKLAIKKNVDWVKVYMTFPIIVFFGTALWGSLNLGIRHLLPIFPFMFIMISDLVNKIDFKKAFKGKKINVNALSGFGFSILLIWYVVGSLNTYPHYLSYFNETIGARDNARKYIADSNLDWGQGLKRLASYIENENIDKIYVDYFGSGDVDYYLGDKGVKWKAEYGRPASGYYAISTSSYTLMTSKHRDTGEYLNENYLWIKELEPIDTVSGGAIMIFEIK